MTKFQIPWDATEAVVFLPTTVVRNRSQLKADHGRKRVREEEGKDGLGKPC